MMIRMFSACSGRALVTGFALACAGPVLATEGSTYGGPIGRRRHSRRLPPAGTRGFYLSLVDSPGWTTAVWARNAHMACFDGDADQVGKGLVDE